MIEGKLPIPHDFLSEDYKTPYKIFNLVSTSAELIEITSEIDTFLNVDKKNKRF